MTTPNFDSYWARKFQVKPLHHLYYFTEKTFKEIVKSAGLVPLRWRPLNRVRDLKALYISPNIKRGLISRALSIAFRLLPMRSFCIRLPLNDDLIMLAQRPRPETLNKESKGFRA